MKLSLSIIAVLFSTILLAQSTIVLPSVTQVITRDTVVESDNPPGNQFKYLICPGVTVWESANVTSLATYYMDSGSVVKIDTNAYTFVKCFMKATSSFTANGALPGPKIQIDSILHETPVTINDTAGVFMGFVGSSPGLTFDYSNLPGGQGCPNTTGIRTVKTLPVHVWPNPANDIVYVSLKSKSSNPVFKVTSVTGQNVKVEVNYFNGLAKLRTADLTQGVYLVHANDGSSTWSGRFVISR